MKTKFKVHWFSLLPRYLRRDGSLDESAGTVRVGAPYDGCEIIAEHGQVDVRPCSTRRQPGATITAPPQVLVPLLPDR
ncbi:hypothetical protein ACGFNP_34300 [Nonomuraea sp. NPDC049269]